MTWQSDRLWMSQKGCITFNVTLPLENRPNVTDSAMPRIGYARVSTTDQVLDIQIARLKAAGCNIIRQETGSGAS